MANLSALGFDPATGHQKRADLGDTIFTSTITEPADADAAIDQYALIKAAATAGRYVMFQPADDPILAIGVAFQSAAAPGDKFLAVFALGQQTPLLSDGTAPISPGQTLVPSTTVAGRVKPGSTGTIATALSAAPAVLNSVVQGR